MADSNSRARSISVNPTEMDPKDVSRWVATLGGSATRFSPLFKDVNGYDLMLLSDVDLKTMGVKNRSVRKKILMSTEKMKEVSMNFTVDSDFDLVDTIKQWGNFAYYFSDYVDISELIVEFSGLEIPFPGSNFRKLRRGDCTNYYKLREMVGKGAFGVVHRIEDKNSKEIRAAKIIKLGKGGKARKVKKGIMKEIDIMKICKHENVINFIEYFSTKDRLSLILEFLAGKNLLERLLDQDGFSEPQALCFFKQMSHSIDYLHSIDIAHRDVKLDNFLLQNWSNDARIVLADFGLSHRLRRNDVLSHPCGTLGYTAPEVVKAQPYDLKCDTWSLGVCLFVMLAGFPPFEGDTQVELRDLIVSGEYSMETREWAKVTDAAKDLTKGLLTYDQELRYSSKDVIAHGWLYGKGGDQARSERSRFTRSATSATFNSKTSEALSPAEVNDVQE